jgi:hypothetical protein
MPHFHFVVYSNPAPGREDEYNDWYSNQHLKDLRAIPGVVAARRFKLAGTQIRAGAPPHQYLAIYEIEADNVQSFVNEMMERTADGRIQRSTAMSADSSPWFWEEI